MQEVEMNLYRSKKNEAVFQKVNAEQGKKQDDSPTEEQIPVPPTDDISSPINEPDDDDKPTNQIIDEEENGSKMIV
jgi:hypothetical protein